MGATVRDLAAKREGNKVRLSGTVDAPTTGWTVLVENDNDGIAGNLDTTTHAKISAIAPEVGNETLTAVPFDAEVVSPERDTIVAIQLAGLTTEDGAARTSVQIEG